MNKTKFLLLAIFTILLMTSFVNTVKGYFPDTHTKIIIDSCKQMEGKQTSVSIIVCNNMREAIAGDLASDISVIFYFTQFQKYEVTHSPLFCARMIEEAKNERQLAFAYGSCSHHPSDSSSHNNLIPYAILHTFQPNYFIHPIAEEAINDKIVTKSLSVQTREALDIFKEDCPNIDSSDCKNEFIAQLERVLKNDNTYQGTLGSRAGFQGLDIKKLVGLFVAQVQGDSGYSLGYSSIFAVPFVLVAVIILALIVGIILLVIIFKKQERSFITKWIAVPFIAFWTIISLLAIIGLFTGTAFQMYKFISAPLTFIVPIGNYNQYLELGIQDTIRFFNSGNTFTILDPTGIGAIRQAEAPLKWVWWALIILFGLYIIWLLWKVFFKKGKNKGKKR